jgi:hypothetical protein
LPADEALPDSRFTWASLERPVTPPSHVDYRPSA